jgi:hypothetical protein
LIDELVIDVLEGRLHLPISSEKLSEVGASGYLSLETKKTEWVLHSRPQ